MIIDSPIISSSQFISGSSTQIGNAVISGSLTVTGTINAAITGSITSASYANFAETSVSSSYALTASYAANVPLTASNANTASYAFFAVTASYASNVPLTASNADTASYSFFAVTASYAANVPTTASNANTASYAFSAVSASYASNAELLDGRDSTTFAGTGSNQFTGSQYISNTDNATSFISTAALYTDGGLRVAKDAYVSGTVYVNNLTVYGTSSIQYTTSSQVDIGANIITVNTATPAIRFGGYAVFDSGSTGTGLTGSLLWDSELNRWVYSNPSGSEYDGGILISGPKNSSGLGNEQSLAANYITKGQGGDHITASQIFDNGTTVSIPGNLTVTGSVTGTITNAISASYSVSSSLADNAQTASYFITSSVTNATSASYATTASYAFTSPLYNNLTAQISASTQILSSNTTLYNLSSFRAAMVDYVVSTSGSGTSMRAGTFTANWNGTASMSNESMTMDIGDTSMVQFSADSTGSIFVNISSGSWEIESLYRALGTAIPTGSAPPPPTGSFSGTINVHEIGACVTSPIATFSVTGDASTFCACTQFSGAGFTGLTAGNYQAKFGLNVLNMTTDGSSVAIVNTGIPCVTCE